MKTTKKILSVLLACLLIVPSLYIQVAATGETIWDGTADTSWYNDTDTTFELSTAKQLAGLATLVNGGNDFAGKTIKLVADIYLNDTTNYDSWSEKNAPAHPWTPIGHYDTVWYYFSGTFDGQGNTIYGLYVSGAGRVGFFGTIGNNVTIKDVNFEKAYIYSTSARNGVLVGQIGQTPATISGVSINNFNLNSTNAYNAVIVGDIAASVAANISDCSIKNGTIKGTTGNGFVTGFIDGSSTNTKSVSNIDVESVTLTATGANNGGIVGRIQACTTFDIQNVNIKNSSVSASGKDYAGLLIGIADKATTGITCNNINIIGSTVAANKCALGVGYAAVDVKAATLSNINIEGSTVTSASANTAGVFGAMKGPSVSFANIAVNSTTSISGKGGGVGGIMGNSDGSATTITMNNCAFAGTVTNTSERTGGLLGCYNNGDTAVTTINNCLMSGTVNGTGYVGGIIGYGIHNNHKFTVTNTMMTGTVKATAGSNYGALIGNYGGSSTQTATGTFTLNNFYYAGTFTNGSSALDAKLYGTVRLGTNSFASGATFYTPLTDADELGRANSDSDCSAFYAALDPLLWTSDGKLYISYPEESRPLDTFWYSDSATSFYIKTAAQLKGFAALVNSGKTFSGKTVYLANDITLNDVSNFANWGTTAPANKWTPIGTDTSSQRFEGTFNGQGYKVIGMYIAPDAISGIGNYGFFSMLQSGANFSNFTLENAYVNHNSGCVGIVFGQAGSVGTKTLSNITVKDSVINTASGSGTGVMIGKINGATELTFDNCDIVNTQATAGAGKLGGMFGFVNNSGANIGTLAFTNCDVDLDITSSSGSVGGFIADIISVSKLEKINFTDCTLDSTITASGKDYVGGYIGVIESTYPIQSINFTRCTAKGTLTGANYVAGFIGRTNSTASGDNTVAYNFTDCDTTGLTINSSAMRASDCIGYVRYAITSLTADGCKFNANIVSSSTQNGHLAGSLETTCPTITVTDSSSAGTISGGQYEGILIGKLPVAGNVTVDGYVAKDIVKTTSSHAGLIAHTGGTLNGTISFNNVWFDAAIIGAASSEGLGGLIGEITSTAGAVEVSNYLYTGSIAGYNNLGPVIGRAATNTLPVTVTNSAMMGTITGTKTDSGEIGAVVGRFSGGASAQLTLNNVYYDTIIKSANANYKTSIGNVTSAASMNMASTLYTPDTDNSKVAKQADTAGFYDALTAEIWGARNSGALYLKSFVDSNVSVWDGSIDTSWYNSTDKVFKISTAAQLAGFRDIVNNGGSAAMAGITIMLETNIDLNNREWTPIGLYDGSAYHTFNGTFDGNGYTISNFKVTTTGKTSNDRYGFFAWAEDKTVVCDLVIDNADISGNAATGIVVGQIKGTPTFRDIDVINSKATSTAGNVGGIAGQVGSYNTITFENCYVNAELSSTMGIPVGGILGTVPKVGTATTLNFIGCSTENTLYAYAEVGGLLGQFNATADAKAINIIDCTTNDTFDTTYNNIGLRTRQNCGGLIGDIVQPKGLTLNIKDTNVAGTMKACQNSGAMIGRIQDVEGMTALNVTNSTSDYTINAAAADTVADEATGVKDATSQCIGSVIGLAQNSIGTITLTGYKANDTIIATGGNIGILGSLNAVGAITATDVIVTSDITSGGTVGGLVGKLQGDTAITVDGYYFDVKGDVSGYFGGLVGNVATEGASITASNVIILGTNNTGYRNGALAGNISGEKNAAIAVAITTDNFYYDMLYAKGKVSMIYSDYRTDKDALTYSSPLDEDNLPVADVCTTFFENMPDDIKAIDAGRTSTEWKIIDKAEYKDEYTRAWIDDANPAHGTLMTEDNVKVNNTTMKMLGASIRLITPYGLRFAAQVDDLPADSKVTIEEYGMLLLPEKMLGANELTLNTLDVLKVPADVFFTEDNPAYKENKHTYSAVLWNIPESGFTTDVCARGYVIYSDGTCQYTDVATRNYEGVAKACYSAQSDTVKAQLVDIFGNIFG